MNPIRLFALLIGCITALGITQQVQAHNNSAYARTNGYGPVFAKWMLNVPDTVTFHELSLPGTHDSAANQWGGETTETQTMSIAAQLDAGIRVLDIRYGRGNLAHCSDDRYLYLWHGDTCMYSKLDEAVLQPVRAFLQRNPSEAVFIKLQPATGDTLSEEELGNALYEKLQNSGISFYNGNTRNPTLGEIRGKAVIMPSYMSTEADIIAPLAKTINWNSHAENPNSWSCTTNWSLASGWRNKRAHLDRINAADASKFYTVSLTGNTGCFPYFAASGHSSWETGAPRLLTGMTRGVINTCSGSDNCIREFPSVNCFLGTCSVAFEGLNTLTMDYINANIHKRAGIVMADFPGLGLIQAVFNVNYEAIPQAPKLRISGPDSINEGDSAAFVFSIDPVDGDRVHKLEIDWGEVCLSDGAIAEKSCGTTKRKIDGGAQNVIIHHRMLDDPDESLASTPPPAKAIDMMTIKATLSDDTFQVNAFKDIFVRNAKPTLDIPNTLKINDPLRPGVTLKFAILDPGINDSFTVNVDWGDGRKDVFSYSSSTPDSFPVHRYGKNGDYIIRLRITDNDGAYTDYKVSVLAGGKTGTTIKK